VRNRTPVPHHVWGPERNSFVVEPGHVRGRVFDQDTHGQVHCEAGGSFVARSGIAHAPRVLGGRQSDFQALPIDDLRKCANYEMAKET
jgi:hypothetical protein